MTEARSDGDCPAQFNCACPAPTRATCPPPIIIADKPVGSQPRGLISRKETAMNTFGKKTSAILVLALCFTAIDAQACGEVMYRMGGALRYHAFITRHPANILLYSGPAALQHTSANEQKFHENLEKAGH